MNNEAIHHYGEEFNTTAAQVMIPYLLQLFHPKCIVDVGCGTGTWLKVFNGLGVDDYIGIDGEHVTDLNQLLIPTENFKAQDIEHLSLSSINRTFDLVLCLEVAEHIHEQFANNLVENLCGLGNVIVFSAAVPGQTGENHVNEQYPTYWNEKFKVHGYSFVDIIRPQYWSNSKIEWWYRQNMFVVANEAAMRQYNFQEWNGDIVIIKDLLELHVKMYENRDKSILQAITRRLRSILTGKG